jgi:hypothetical protein
MALISAIKYRSKQVSGAALGFGLGVFAGSMIVMNLNDI